MLNEEIKIDKGSVDTFFAGDGGNIFGIAFDKIFNMEKLSVYNDFDMTSKRNFKNLTYLILETYEELFLDEGGRFKSDAALVLYNILSIKSKLIVNQTPFSEFIDCIDKITDSADKLLIKMIDEFVEQNYALNLDELTDATKEKKKKVNEELQFSDNHARTLLKISYLYRVMIPIISVYFSFNKSNLTNIRVNGDIEEVDEEELRFEEANSMIFSHLFEKFSKKDTEALRNKLYKLTHSRISRTAYSDKRFWLAAKNVAITKETEALEIYKKLLTNALPKLSIDGDKNIISFLQSVINNQIDFLFQNKFKHKFTTLGNNADHYGDEDNDDDVSEFERIEIQTARTNEGSYIIRKLNIADVVDSIPEKLGVGVTDAEVKHLIRTLNRNSIQEQIVSMLTFKYFDDKNAMKFIDFYQYCYLVIAFKKFLEEHKFVYLPVLLTANCQKHKERVNICGKKVRPEILGSKKYTDLFKTKYKNFEKEVDEPFLSFIGTTYSSIFTDENGEEIFDASVKVAKIAEEILDVATLIG